MKKFSFILIFTLSLILSVVFSACDGCEHEYLNDAPHGLCEQEVTYTKECVKCGEVSEFTLPATGHSFEKTVILPTCTLAGYTEYVCDCGFSYRSEIKSASGHDYRNTVTEPTCTEVGFTRHDCKVCNATIKDNYKSYLGHDFISEKIEPTCTEQGYVKYSCKNCEYFYNGDFCEPTGHSLSSSTVPPDCVNRGYTEYKCTTCEYAYRTDYSNQLGHNFVSEVISVADCTVQGECKYSCACGATYSEITPPLGHDFKTKVVNPTVSDMGYTEYSCDCGFNYKGNYRFYSEILDNAYAGNDKVLARGIDISKWNHKVDSQGNYLPMDWVALKESGVDFVILKIGSTIRENGELGGIEPTFEADYEGAKAAGLDVGVYFFTYSTTVSGIKADAERLLTYLDGKQFEYPIYLDIENQEDEEYYPSEIAPPILTEMCLEFFSTLQREGYYTGLYVNNEFLFNIMQTDNMIELFDIWYARYPSWDPIEWNGDETDDPVWNTEKYGEHLGMWQYTKCGVHANIVGDVDLNFAYKDYPSIIKQNNFNGYVN